MIEIRKKEEGKKPYWFDIYANGELLSQEVYFDEEKELYVNDNLVEDFKSEPVLELPISEFPSDLNLRILEFDIKEQVFDLLSVTKTDDKVSLLFNAPFHNTEKELKWKVRKFYPAIGKELKNHSNIKYELSDNFSDYWNNYLSIWVYFYDCKHKTLNKLIQEAKILLQDILKKTEDRLLDNKWKTEYEKNEPIFTKEVVLPLLKNLGFKQVKYNHGVKEFGKDVIFSNINKFNQKEYFAVQVKAGDVSGSVRGDIDELINQIDDAFKVPLQLIDTKSEIYISKLIIAISGNFTDNAKIKIRNKVNNIILGNLIFWDKDEILNLL